MDLVGEGAGEGHRLARWRGRRVEELTRSWALPDLVVFDRVGSTNDVAKELAVKGAPAGTVVLADEQTAGRGREGRAWASPAGLGIWLSMILRPQQGSDAGSLPLLVGLAAAEALDPFTDSAVSIKWPNDLWIRDRKLGGILCEGAWSVGSGPSSVIVGIGINVLQAAPDFPPDVRSTATSVAMESDRTPDGVAVAAALVSALNELRAGELALDAETLARISARDCLRGRTIEVRQPGTDTILAVGRMTGLQSDGALLLHPPAARKPLVIRAGTIRLREE